MLVWNMTPKNAKCVFELPEMLHYINSPGTPQAFHLFFFMPDSFVNASKLDSEDAVW